MSKRIMFSLLLLIGASFFILQNVTFNFLLFWSWLPLALGFLVWGHAIQKQTPPKILGAYGFLVCSIIFSYFYHLAWYFDWAGTRSSNSTTSLIFVFAPLYAVILGVVGYVAGYVLASYIGRHRRSTSA